jgi:hypothetical protein
LRTHDIFLEPISRREDGEKIPTLYIHCEAKWFLRNCSRIYNEEKFHLGCHNESKQRKAQCFRGVAKTGYEQHYVRPTKSEIWTFLGVSTSISKTTSENDKENLIITTLRVTFSMGTDSFFPWWESVFYNHRFNSFLYEWLRFVTS